MNTLHMVEGGVMFCYRVGEGLGQGKGFKVVQGFHYH